MTLRCLWLACAACALSATGCADRAVTIPAESEKPNATVDQVCTLTAELFALNREAITAKTSLGELGADELDFVELVMELEETFEVAIPDESLEGMMETENWQDGIKSVTMEKLASFVDNQRQSSPSGGTRSKRSVESSEKPELDADSPSPSSQTSGEGTMQVKVFLNPLLMLLAGAEQKKGKPLTREEVLEIRDNAAFVMMSPEQARKFYSSLDAQVSVHRMNPDRIWEEWQDIRHQVK